MCVCYISLTLVWNLGCLYNLGAAAEQLIPMQFYQWVLGHPSLSSLLILGLHVSRTFVKQCMQCFDILLLSALLMCV